MCALFESRFARLLTGLCHARGRLRNQAAYQDFLKCLNLYAQEIIPRAELQMLVGDILIRQGHSDLQARACLKQALLGRCM